MLYSLDSNGKIANPKKTDKTHPKVGLEPIRNIFTAAPIIGGLLESNGTKASKLSDWLIWAETFDLVLLTQNSANGTTSYICTVSQRYF